MAFGPFRFRSWWVGAVAAAGHRRGGQLGRPHARVAAVVSFGVLQRPVCPAQQLRDAQPAVRAGGDEADAGPHRDRDRAAARQQVHRFGDDGEQLRRHLLGGAGLLGQHEGELVAAEPKRRAAAGLGPVTQAAGEQDQQLVAAAVADLFVDGGEVVQVEQREHDRPGRVAAGDVLVQRVPVAQPGERVVGEVVFGAAQRPAQPPEPGYGNRVSDDGAGQDRGGRGERDRVQRRHGGPHLPSGVLGREVFGGSR